MLEEGRGGVRDVHDLLWSPPALRRTLLEGTEGVAVAVVEVADAGLLAGCRERDDRSVRLVRGGREGSDGGDDLLRDPHLLGVQVRIAARPNGGPFRSAGRRR